MDRVNADAPYLGTSSATVSALRDVDAFGAKLVWNSI